MTPKDGYDVLRLIEHGQICYISSEYVEGEILAGWMRRHKNMSKEQLFSLIENIAKQLNLIHKCRKKPACQYVNPYSIVVTEEESAYFLDMEDGSNEESLRFMQKRVVRESFLPAEEPYYQRAGIELDIYGLGKTIQYLLSMAGPDPPLSRREEKRFLKIISKCLKYQTRASYANVSEIRRQLPRYRQKKKQMSGGRKKLLLAAGVLVLCFIMWNTWRGHFELASEPGIEQGIHLGEPDDTEVDSEEYGGTYPADSEEQDEALISRDQKDLRDAYMELAVMYLTDVKDYNKSIECLEKIEEGYGPAEDLKMVAMALLGKKENPEGLEDSIEKLRSLGDLDSGIPVDDEARYYLCLIKGYAVLDTEQSAESILFLGRRCLNLAKAEGETGKDIRECMASAFERTDRPKDAAYLYEEILAEETEIGKREELMIQHIRLLCMDVSTDRNLCAQTIQEHLRRMPGILEKEEFQRLQREYEIQVEGDQVWVGR